MAKLLYRLGRISFRRRWTVLSVWLLVLATLGLGALVFQEPTDDSFAIPGTESQDTIDLLEERFPDESGGVVQVTFQAPDGQDLTSERYLDAISGTLDEYEQVTGVESTTDPFQGLRDAQEERAEGITEAEEQARTQVENELAGVPETLVPEWERELLVEEAQEEARAEVPDLDVDEILEELPYAAEDRETAVAQVRFDEPDGEIGPDQVTELMRTVGPATDEGLDVNFTGAPIDAAEVDQIDGAEAAGVVVALVLLAVNFGALVAAGLPIVAATAGVGAGIAGVYIATGFIDLSSTAPILALMLGLALGIDYSLFLLARYRQLRAAGTEPQEATAWAVGTAGSAVVFAGVTNVVALLGLAVIQIPFLTIMGIAAAFTVTVVVLVVLTLLPALFAITRGSTMAGRLPVLGRRAERAVTSENTLGARWVRLMVKRPVLPVVAVLSILVTLLIPMRDLHLALPTGEANPPDNTQRAAYEAITDGLGEGYNAPLSVAVDLAQATSPDEATDDVAEHVADLPQVHEVLPATLNDDDNGGDGNADTAVLTVIPESGPTAPDTEALLHDIRALDPTEITAEPVTLSVTGPTAMSIDISERLGDAMPVFLSVVVGLALILLVLVFRSILVPIKTALSFALSSMAALGATVVVFQWGYGADALGLITTDSLISFMPILVIALMFGLAMDYEMFLVSRMREDYIRTGDAQGAIVTGYRQAARVVAVAAFIMIAVFGFFVWGDSTMIQPIAFALAAGVFLDAILVRMTLVPAVMAMFGGAAWWLPRWLDRILPNVDVEGDRLAQALRNSGTRPATETDTPS
ncbi:MMPL family transporter [Lipingzhangella sp. LS1_29]|uniref:MMPL family transporter n=1 Tax=Lipingzhangella rawalii TaxID=2055835 RepID=A0ABU2H4X1_9ACTN|nr:MMPL family transporter [Lipingzhangella rawalii]MDS1270336.1 MMPL family transporter [Lipingzhangella rawalii]